VEAGLRETAAETKVSAAQAETKRVAAEAEERQKRFAHVQAMFGKKESAFGDRLAAARETAEAAQAESAAAVAAAGEATADKTAAEERLLEVERQLTSALDAGRAAEARAEEAEVALEVVEGQLAAAQSVAISTSELEARADKLGTQLGEAEEAKLLAAFRAEAAETAAQKAEERLAVALAKAESAVVEADALRAAARERLVATDHAHGGDKEHKDAASVQEVVVQVDSGEGEEVREQEEDVGVIRERLADAEKRMAASAAAQSAKITVLEKANAQLTWQVAMLADSAGEGGQSAGNAVLKPVSGHAVRPGEDGRSEGVTQPSGGLTMASVVGWTLAHRKQLVVGYLVVLHLLVYFALTHGVFSFSSYGTTTSAECEAALNKVKASGGAPPALD
jgi:hypothetical protein